MKRGQPGYVSPNKGRKRDPKHVAAALAARMQNSRSIEERFWEKVEKRGPDECWPWVGAITSRNYGQMYTHTDGTKMVRDLAHRLAWIIEHGSIPDSLVIDHKCKNTRCVNTRHLRPVTQRDNSTIYAKETTPARINRAATHCKHGHEFTAANTMSVRRWPNARNCKACSVLHARAEKWAKRLDMPPRPEWLAKYRSEQSPSSTSRK